MARDKIYLEEEFPSPLQQLWYNFKQTNVALIGFSGYVLCIACQFYRIWIRSWRWSNGKYECI